jgi:hypothetical protein
METMIAPGATTCETIDLIDDQRLIVERRPSDSLIRIVGGNGRVSLTIEVTAAGPLLRFEGLSLRIESDGDLGIGARRIALHGREGVVISSGGDASIEAVGDLSTAAAEQNISARLGNVNVKANDDVRLGGERIKLNC